MPSSSSSQISVIVQLISLTNPQSLLDIGVGFGKYGFLAREYLELWDGRERYSEWTRRIDGVEAYHEYLTPIHRLIYNDLYEGNALDVIKELTFRYDLALLIDVLEHFEAADGERLLREVRGKARNLLISTPKHPGHQDAAFGNPFEKHLSEWTTKGFNVLGEFAVIPNPDSLIIYAGDEAPRVKRQLSFSGAHEQGAALRRIVANRAPFLRAPYRALKKLLP